QTRYVVADENQRLSMTNIQRQADEGQQWIGISGANPIDTGQVQAVDLGIDKDLLMNLHILRTRRWAECMGLLGIDNSNNDKKERLVEAEVDSNKDQTSMMRLVNLKARRQAADQINQAYGLDVSVEYSTDRERGTTEDQLGLDNDEETG